MLTVFVQTLIWTENISYFDSPCYNMSGRFYILSDDNSRESYSTCSQIVQIASLPVVLLN